MTFVFASSSAPSFGCHETAKIPSKVMEEKINVENVEVASVTMQDGFKVYKTEQLAELLQRL